MKSLTAIVICRLANRLLIRPQTSSWAPGAPFRGSYYVLIRSRGLTRPICRFFANETGTFRCLSSSSCLCRLALGAQLANFSPFRRQPTGRRQVPRRNAPLRRQPPAVVFVHLTPRASQRILSRDMVCGIRRFMEARKLLQDRSAK
jgi:hypothetical protein